MQVDVAHAFVAYAVAIVCVLLLASPAAAQFDRGTISGVVKDQSGAVVPGVTVTAKSLQTQELATAVTDASGFFTMTTLRPGRYDVSAELDGFKKASRSGVQLDGGRGHQGGVHAGGGQPLGNGHGRRAGHADPDRRDHPEDRRGQGHRAALVLGPQPDRRPRAEAGRRRRQLQQRGLRRLHATAASASTAAGPTRTRSRSTARSPSARGRPARSSACRTSTRSRKCRC